jgi:hypothetical protein
MLRGAERLPRAAMLRSHESREITGRRPGDAPGVASAGPAARRGRAKALAAARRPAALPLSARPCRARPLQVDIQLAKAVAETGPAEDDETLRRAGARWPPAAALPWLQRMG